MTNKATENRAELIAALVVVQNHPFHQNHDIMTFAGMCDNTELRAHLEACIKEVGGA